jgi:hypothetical protein
LLHFSYEVVKSGKSGFFLKVDIYMSTPESIKETRALTTAEFATIFTTKSQYETKINNIPASDGTEDGDAEYDRKILAVLTALNTDNDKLTDYISKINIDIINVKKNNTKLKFDLGEIDTDINGSDELIENYKYLYSRNYIKNISMAIGVIFASIYLVKGFR